MPVRSSAGTSFARPKARTRDIRFTLKIKAKPEQVYRALTSATELCRWWLQGAETDARNSGRFRMVWPKLRRPSAQADAPGRERAFPQSVALGDSEGFFVDLEPGRKVAWMWKPRKRTYPPLSSFFIVPAGRGSEVMLLHGGFSSSRSADKYYRGCCEGWEDCLAKLKLYLETGRTAKSQTLTFDDLGKLMEARK